MNRWINRIDNKEIYRRKAEICLVNLTFSKLQKVLKSDIFKVIYRRDFLEGHDRSGF